MQLGKKRKLGTATPELVYELRQNFQYSQVRITSRKSFGSLTNSELFIDVIISSQDVRDA